MLSTTEIFSLYGNVIGLDLYAPHEMIHSDLVEQKSMKMR